jgi:hypothetical protein
MTPYNTSPALLVEAQHAVDRLTDALKSIGVIIDVRPILRAGGPEVRGDGWAEALEKLAIWVEEHAPADAMKRIPAIPTPTHARDAWPVAGRLASILEGIGVPLDQVRIPGYNSDDEHQRIRFWARVAAAEKLAVFIEEHTR